MSLSKSYEVSCDSTNLHMRREIAADPDVDLDASRPVRSALRTDCAYYSRREWSSKLARATAKKDGWVRYSESLPLYRGAPEQDQTKATFDICPACAPKVIPDHLPAGWSLTCLGCSEELTWHAETGTWMAGDVEPCAYDATRRHRPKVTRTSA